MSAKHLSECKMNLIYITLSSSQQKIVSINNTVTPPSLIMQDQA